jgi:hypothetical protein
VRDRFVLVQSTQRQLPKELQLDGWSCAGAPPLSHTAPVKELRTAAYGRAGKYSGVSAPVLFVYGRWNIVCENLTMNAERTQQTSTGIACLPFCKERLADCQG